MIKFVKKYKFSLLSGVSCLLIAIIVAYKVYFSHEKNMAIAIIYAMPFLFVTFMEIDYVFSNMKKHKKE